jgi:hypothetical protein
MRLTDPGYLFVLWTLSTMTVLHAQVNPQQCGSLTNAYGPFDYRTNKAELDVVERFHFTTEVELLLRGKSGTIGGDLDYTLRASPNHHRALLALMNYGERLKTLRAPNTNYDIECYFIRAVTFRRDDTTARMLYATFLRQRGRLDDGLRQLDIASTFAGDNPFTHYNLGLSYLEMNSFEKARQYARSALDLGMPKTQLKERLIAAGQWTDTTAKEDGNAAPRSPASAASR